MGGGVVLSLVWGVGFGGFSFLLVDGYVSGVVLSGVGLCVAWVLWVGVIVFVGCWVCCERYFGYLA